MIFKESDLNVFKRMVTVTGYHADRDSLATLCADFTFEITIWLLTAPPRLLSLRKSF